MKAIVYTKYGSPDVLQLTDVVKPNQEDLVFMKELLETRKVIPVIDTCYLLSKVPEALRYLGEGHVKG